MLIFSFCPHCQAEHELSEVLIGDTVNCQKCRQPFEVKEANVDEQKTIPLDSAFADGHMLAGNSTQPQANPQFMKGKISLALPPTPKELWSNNKDEEPTDGFPEFRHNSRAVRKFLDRDDVSDYSWLLAAGLMASMLLVLTFLGLFIYLMAR